MASRSLNKALLIGNLTRDPELKYTPNGAAVCTFGLATNTNWKKPDGTVEEITEYHNIVCWNKLGEICSQLLKVGSKVFVEGEIRTRTWEDDSGKHYRTEIKISDMMLLGNGKMSSGASSIASDDNASDDVTAAPKKGKKAPAPEADEDLVIEEEDLPF